VGTISPLATELMLELRLFTTPGSTSEVYASTTALRVSGGVLSIERDPIRSVTYAQGQWAYRGKQFRMLAVSGGARLVFGNAREPTIISDPIDHFLFTGPILSTDGVPIAKYNEHQNTWLGLLRPMWWLSMRIVEIDILRSMADRRGHSAAFSRQPQSPIETTARSAPGAEKGKNCTV
jgi:hypothetical protein